MPSEPSNLCYLLKPTDRESPPELVRLASTLAPEVRVVARDTFLRELPGGGGWLLVAEGAPAEELVGVLTVLGRSPAPWGILLLLREQDGRRVLPISVGYPVEASGAGERLAAGGIEAGYLGHRHLLEELSRVRHDINNALTSALAETQFLRMDVEDDSELAGALSLVEAQLQRIRDLTSELAAVRVVR